LAELSSIARASLGLLAALSLLTIACDAPPTLPTPSTPPAGPQPTTTTIVVVVTMPPPPATASPTIPPAAPVAAVAPDQLLTLVSDGISVPPRFTLAGGDYEVSWAAVRPAADRDCTFSAMLMSEPLVSPSTLQTLGPRLMTEGATLTGSTRMSGLGAGGYTLRSTGDCRWTVTIRPLQAR
jgi:hypothetical protein